MIPYPKRLIEVDLPIKKISEHARREKSIRHGHISTLHIWWAWRPLAACRAVICAALWPDPGDPNCPEKFKPEAARLMKAFRDRHGGQPYDWNGGIELRKALLDFIADFANWDNSTNRDFLETSRKLTQIAHESLGGEPGTRPLVVDPFAGGGSIPLEALRVCADAFASDLNPVAVLLNKVILEYIPKYGQRLADEVRKWGEWIKKEAEKELAEFYPKGTDGTMPIAYLWARTIKCEGPGCGAEVPLVKATVLDSKTVNKEVNLEIGKDNGRPIVKTHVYYGKPVKNTTVTVRGWSVTCPVCDFTTTKKRVQAQLALKTGGTSESRLLAVVVSTLGRSGKRFRNPTKEDLEVIAKTHESLKKPYYKAILDSLLVELPNRNAHRAVGSQLPLYGLKRYIDIYLPRQRLTLACLAHAILRIPPQAQRSTVRYGC